MEENLGVSLKNFSVSSFLSRISSSAKFTTSCRTTLTQWAMAGTWWETFTCSSPGNTWVSPHSHCASFLPCCWRTRLMFMFSCSQTAACCWKKWSLETSAGRWSLWLATWPTAFSTGTSTELAAGTEEPRGTPPAHLPWFLFFFFFWNDFLKKLIKNHANIRSVVWFVSLWSVSVLSSVKKNQPSVFKYVSDL